MYGRNGSSGGRKFDGAGKDVWGIEKDTKTVNLVENSAQYVTSLRVVSWKDYVLPSW
jgi:hypothetical protein